MAYSGYPTPDNFNGDVDYICIPIIVPNKTEFLAAIYGLYGQMSNEWFWREFGSMSPETAALLSSYGLARTEAYANCEVAMTCADIADCISNDITVINAINTSVSNSGYINPDVVNPDTPEMNNRLPASQRQQDIAQAPAGCDKDALWAGIRSGLVVYLDDTARNFLEDAVTVADKAERAASIISAIPVVGNLAAAVITQFVELAPDLLNLFNAYSSESVLDQVACDIFEMVCEECRYPTYDELFSYFASAGISGLDDIANLTLTAITDYLFDSSQLASMVCWYTIVTYELFVLYLGSKFGIANGVKSLEIWTSLGEDFANDNWIVLCDGCEDTGDAYYIDFTTEGLGNWAIQNGTYVAGVGVQSVQVNTVEGINLYCTLPANWNFDRFSIEYTRQGDGSFQDWTRIYSYTNYPSSSGRLTIYDGTFGVNPQGTYFECPVSFITPAARTTFMFQLQDNNVGNTMVLKRMKLWKNDGSAVGTLPLNSTIGCLS